MDFYHNLITGKSWQVLQALRKSYNFVLIGGWAVFLYTRALKSKDIDLVLEFEELEKLREKFDVVKNQRLKKYEARREEVEIDIYVPFYSNPGIPAEEVKNFTRSLEGFRVPEAEVLALLKQRALLARKHSPKGRKDLLDLVSLFRLEEFNWKRYRKLVLQFQTKEVLEEVDGILKGLVQAEELGLNVHRMAQLKRKISPNLTT